MAKDHTIAYGIWKTNPSYIHLQSRYLTQFMHLFLDIPPTHFRSFSLIVSLPLSFSFDTSPKLSSYIPLSLSLFLSLSFYQSLYLFLSLFISLSISLSLPLYFSLCLSLYLTFFLFLSLSLSISLCIPFRDLSLMTWGLLQNILGKKQIVIISKTWAKLFLSVENSPL